MAASICVPLGQAAAMTHEEEICANGPLHPAHELAPGRRPPVAYEEGSPDYLLRHIYPSSQRSKKSRHQTRTNTTTPNNKP